MRIRTRRGAEVERKALLWPRELCCGLAIDVSHVGIEKGPPAQQERAGHFIGTVAIVFSEGLITPTVYSVRAIHKVGYQEARPLRRRV